jgi:hypothetical protein
MRIMFAGHLDRAFLLGSHPGRFRVESSEPEPDAYRSFFHCAGTMAVLSESIVQLHDLPARSGPALTRRGADGRTYDTVDVPQLEDDAFRFAKTVTRADILSEDSLAFSRICARDDPHKPNAIHHVEGLLFVVLHAWRTRSTLVLAAGDRRILAEIANGVVEKGIALPFGIPDLRQSISDADPATGRIPNLEPADVADLNAWRADPALQAYRRRLDRLPGTHRDKIGALLQAAMEQGRKSSSRIRNVASDIAVGVSKAKMLDNTDLPKIEVDPFGWSGSAIVKSKMHVVTLTIGRQLS